MHTYVIAAVVVVSCGLLQGHPVGELWSLRFESRQEHMRPSDNVREGCMEIVMPDVTKSASERPDTNPADMKRQKSKEDIQRMATQAVVQSAKR